MKDQTISRLNQINKDFYKSISEEFSDSRQYFWKGWNQVLNHIENNTQLKVLDIGCGNGRFALFLQEIYRENFTYVGVDSDEKLLSIAKDALSKCSNCTGSDLIQIDIVNELLNNSLEKKLAKKKYDLIVLFGVMHHIPSYDLREKLLNTLSSTLAPKGILVPTFWEFTTSERFAYKQSDPTILGLNPEDLEENDYILDWQRGKTAYRYFHFSDKKEQHSLIGSTGLKLIDSYKSDGKTENLNSYHILQKQDS